MRDEKGVVKKEVAKKYSEEMSEWFDEWVYSFEDHKSLKHELRRFYNTCGHGHYTEPSLWKFVYSAWNLPKLPANQKGFFLASFLEEPEEDAANAGIVKKVDAILEEDGLKLLSKKFKKLHSIDQLRILIAIRNYYLTRSEIKKLGSYWKVFLFDSPLLTSFENVVDYWEKFKNIRNKENWWRKTEGEERYLESNLTFTEKITRKFK